MSRTLLLCLIAGRRAAIPADRVLSVIEVDNLTPIPGAPAFIVGLTALRSQALTVLDCRVALGLEASRAIAGSRAAVIEHEGHRYALLVDEAFEVAEVLSEPVPVPGGFGEGWQNAASGMVETASGPALLVSVEQIVLGPPTGRAAKAA